MSLVDEAVWQELMAELSQKMPQVLYEQWFARAEIMSWDGDLLEIGVQNRFYKSRIETPKYMPLLLEAANAAFGKPVRVMVSVSPKLLAAFRKTQSETVAEELRLAPGAGFPAPVEMPTRQPLGSDLNPDFTFENFVTGPANRLSHAVSLQAVEFPADYNRIFICGQHGVGKTHLLQAVCHETRLRRPGARVAYVTCERFVADFTTAHTTGRLKEFRASYRGLDLLAFDELQTLGVGNKAGTQAELLGIIDELDARGRQIVFAATHAPADLEGVDAKLRDRLGAGFVDKLSLPDMATRRELIVRKLAERGIDVPADSVELMARELSGNVRKLEGTVLRLAALIRIEGMQPTVNCIRLALEMTAPAARKSALTYQDVIGAVAEECGLSAEVVTGRGRNLPVRTARNIALVLCRHLVGGSYAELGAAFGNRSHATIISAMRNIPEASFSDGLEGRPVERILFRLGVHVKPEEILGRKKGLFDS